MWLYSAVFDHLTSLMDRFCDFFQRLNTYLQTVTFDEKLPLELRPSVYRVLAHFLDTMATTYNLTKSRRKRLEHASKKAIFGGNGNIENAFAKLEQLLEAVSMM